jgi:hypothetical protein
MVSAFLAWVVEFRHEAAAAAAAATHEIIKAIFWPPHAWISIHLVCRGALFPT